MYDNFLPKFKCELCGSKFPQKYTLMVHKRTRQGVKYEWELCEFYSNEKQSLKLHKQKVHGKCIEYLCDLCDYQTNKKGVFFLHKRSLHDVLNVMPCLVRNLAL